MFDLLNGRKKLSILEDAKKRVVVVGLKVCVNGLWVLLHTPAGRGTRAWKGGCMASNAPCHLPKLKGGALWSVNLRGYLSCCIMCRSTASHVWS